MITRLTDLTLRCVDTSAVSDETVREFYALAFRMGADLLEVSPANARRLGAQLDPARTILYVKDPSEVLQDFVRYSCHTPELLWSLPVLREVNIKDMRELTRLQGYEDKVSLRIIGLDDLFLQDFRRQLQRLQQQLPASAELCPTNGCGCASAILTEWLLKDGGNGAAAFAGAGGFAPIEEVLLALQLTRKYQKRGDLTVLPRMKQLYEQITGQPLSPYKAVLGSQIFAVKSGIHVDGILKSAKTYEPYPPELVGARRSFSIGKHSGRAGILYLLQQLGYTPDPARLAALLTRIQQHSEQKHRALTTEELLTLAREVGAI
ncbi:MAG: hypothetical protein PHR21_03965 [Oscillospiraceae bacterium]|nr:hypothetical protein [Oscillospiraceae bacterium]MDD4367831.1 hypothetical protein [Oscillospiraceae bacterium]